jgi:ribosomal protein S18 acetylase RimI-like enzyme
MSSQRVVQIADIHDRYHEAAVALLTRFFKEESFATPRDRIAQNFVRMLTDDSCWAAVALEHEQVIGVVTVTTMLYVEWGRLAEIGDLYVDPAHRGRGFARHLVNAAVEWSQQRGCSSVYVTVTPEGEARHRLSRFYQALDFEQTGRTTMMLTASA